MDSSPSQAARDYRIEALKLMLSEAGDDAPRVRSLHPDAEQLAGDLGSAGLADLLWEELDSLERERLRLEDDRRVGGARTAVGFYVRRRMLARFAEFRIVEESLPELWARVVQLSKERVASVCVDIGVRILTVIARSLAGDAQREFLAGLSSAQRQRVRRFARSGEGEGHDADLIALWQAAYDFARDLRGASRADEMLGRVLLATLFQRLPDETRRKAVRSGRTTFCDVLSRTRVLGFERDEDVATAERLAAAALGMDAPHEVNVDEPDDAS